MNNDDRIEWRASRVVIWLLSGAGTLLLAGTLFWAQDIHTRLSVAAEKIEDQNAADAKQTERLMRVETKVEQVERNTADIRTQQQRMEDKLDRVLERVLEGHR